jgi:hypothetical protein
MFNGGSYGSFLHYVLNNISAQNDKNLPFGMSGNSHLFVHNVAHDETTLEIRHPNSKFIKYHPKTQKNDNLGDNISKFADITHKSLLIYPSHNHKLLTINNYYSKIWANWFEDGELADDAEEKTIFVNNLYNNWDISRNTKFNDIPRWVQREFLSMYIFEAFDSHYEWNLLDWYSHPKLYTITTNDILYNFEETIRNVASFCEIDTNNLYNILNDHKTMLSLQKHVDKDEICSNIIKNTLNDGYYIYNELSIIDEAWIQCELRNKGYEIQCDGLNTFPLDTRMLKKITYKI